MKFPNKLLFLPVLALTMGLLTSAQTFAAAKPAVVIPKGMENLQPYMVSAANLGDHDYMQCVRSRMKMPAAQHAVENVAAAQDCRTAKN